MVEQEVRFTSASLSLSGTVALPAADWRYPAVLLVPGSGQIDRNENHKTLRINAFHDIAAHLAGQSIVTLRYDKRGVGASEGDYWTAGLFDNVSDSSAALDYLKSHRSVRPDAVFLLGHSEGALIATRLASG